RLGPRRSRPPFRYEPAPVAGSSPAGAAGNRVVGLVPACLTCAAVVVPQAMAYATIVGLPVQVGLYTALVPMLVDAGLGSSRALLVSTTSTIAALTAVAVESVSPQDAEQAVRAVATLVLLTGAMLLL